MPDSPQSEQLELRRRHSAESVNFAYVSVSQYFWILCLDFRSVSLFSVVRLPQAMAEG
jgi:hypothetical protein